MNIYNKSSALNPREQNKLNYPIGAYNNPKFSISDGVTFIERGTYILFKSEWELVIHALLHVTMNTDQSMHIQSEGIRMTWIERVHAHTPQI